MVTVQKADWRDLTDSELRARLKERGVNPFDIAMFVHHREDEYWVDNYLVPIFGQ